ncbi:hypothetical protein J8281_12620 [Aquimarina sp. U1-2]|uniref:hypothetical protein n=1 Tax=Aquimarina sp. U1-2 TaxID=2823141 RepID=UPI001AECCEE8|nr:hypothetical protein [Aquimarina sp. U1-2]MBP2833033.1 hypothetical protein [Aquimarina sp. U1-2]
MKFNFVNFLIFILCLVSCINQDKEFKEYGYSEKDKDNLKVSLQIADFRTYGEFRDRIREITCNDSLPKITINKNKVTRNIYPLERCDPGFFDPEQKHYVTFTDGKAYHEGYYSKKINLDSLGKLLQNEFSYHMTSKSIRNLECYLIIIESERTENLDGIENFLEKITRDFDNLKTNLKLKIAFWEVVPPILPLPATKTSYEY